MELKLYPIVLYLTLSHFFFYFKHTPSMHKNDVVTAVFTCPFTQGATDEREAAKF